MFYTSLQQQNNFNLNKHNSTYHRNNKQDNSAQNHVETPKHTQMCVRI